MKQPKPSEQRELTLLLLFKDDLPTSGQEGVAIVTESETIRQHLSIASKVESPFQPEPSQLLMDGFVTQDAEHVSSIMPPKVKPVPPGCFVWGWWKKPWESHHRLLAALRDVCNVGEKPTVLLYNQYLRRIYCARLHDLYFVPVANTVELPLRWISKCPSYYASKNHLNGAFFVLEIDSPKYFDPSEILSSYYVDALSFDFDEMERYSIIRPPDGVVGECREIIDQKPNPGGLKATEHTMFALRIFQQKTLTLELTRNSHTTDHELAEAFSKMEWNDVRDLIREFGLDEWSRLHESPKTIEAIVGIASRTMKRNIIRFDLFLIAWLAHNSAFLKSLFSSSSAQMQFIQAMAKWGSEVDAIEQRQLASSLFILIWRAIQARYELADLSEYFRKLPEFEEIAHSTRYGMSGKFYRDHLNHNVRAALVSGFLADQLWTSVTPNMSRVLVSFLAGLFHDIALPISSFESTARTLQGALGDMGITAEFPIAGSLVDRTKLKECLSIVALYASLPKLHELHARNDLNLESHRDEYLKIADSRLLYEEMLCAISDEHSLLSAAVLLYAAAQGKSKGEIGVGIRKIDVAGFGPGHKNAGAELIQLIQAIALHDRKAAGEFPGAKEEPPGLPTGLVWENFPIPTLVAIADELQEWGRPIAKLDQPVIGDAVLKVSPEIVEVEYDVRIESSVLGSAPYSFFEHLFGKIRNLKRISNVANGPSLRVKATMNVKQGELNLVQVGAEGCRLELEQAAKKVIWPRRSEQPSNVSPGPDGDVYVIESTAQFVNGQQRNVARDIILISGEEETRKQLRSHIGKGARVLSFSTDGTRIEVNLPTAHLDVKLDTYIFSRLDRALTVLPGSVDFASDVGIIRAQLVSVNSIYDRAHSLDDPTNRLIHLRPFPHFMDLDWRFSWEAAQQILHFLRNYLGNKRRHVCYLGCPTLAIYHTLYADEAGKSWVLIDKGHYAIDKWIEERIIDKDRVRKFDVRQPLSKELMNSFDIVIFDPPWYKDDYTIFWRRALELVKKNGVVGVCEYPGYDNEKRKGFSEIRKAILRMPTPTGFFASLSISYAPPPFEQFWGKDGEFTDSATRAYRPTFIDFYRIATTSAKVVGGQLIPELDLAKVIPLEGGHYVRCREDLDWSILSTQGIHIRTRKDLDRYKKDDRRILAWSTNNSIIEVAPDGGVRVSNEQDFRECILNWEKKGATR